MTKQFIETIIFSKLWLKLGLDNDDLLELQELLMKNPSYGTVIAGSGGARKLRLALSNKGKSGGVRVIYVDVPQDGQIHFLLCYPKSKQEDLTEAQRRQLKAFIKTIKEGKKNG